jgi:hypothetical protein
LETSEDVLRTLERSEDVIGTLDNGRERGQRLLRNVEVYYTGLEASKDVLSIPKLLYRTSKYFAGLCRSLQIFRGLCRALEVYIDLERGIQYLGDTAHILLHIPPGVWPRV